MELEAERVGAEQERLILAQIGRREVRRVVGEVERVAVPMQHGEIFFGQRSEAGFPPRVAQRERLPADLLEAGGVDARAQRGRHQLGAEADAEGRQAAGEAFADHCDLMREKRVDVGLVNADRAPEDDQQVGRRRVDLCQRIARRVDMADRDAAFRQQGREYAQILEPDMRHHGRGPQLPSGGITRHFR